MGLLSSGRCALAQDKAAVPPPPVPVHAMPDLPPLPEPANPPAPLPQPGAPGSFPAPVKVDSQPVSSAFVASPDPTSNFASLPRSNEASPGRPPAFRLLVPPPQAQNTSHYTAT